MFARTRFARLVQQAACMLMSIVIVGASLSVGALDTRLSAAHSGYCVTVTQLS